MYFGNVCHSVAPPPPLARPVPGRTEASPDVHPILPFRLLHQFADQMDHVREVVIGSGFSLTSPLKRKASSCGVCRLRFNSDAQAASHYRGTKHAKRLKALDAPDSKIKTPEPVVMETTSQILTSSGSDAATREASASKPTSEEEPSSNGPSETLRTPPGPSPSSGTRTPEKETQRYGEAEVTPEGETEEEKAVRLLYCSLCKVAVNSASQLQAHSSGTKHKTMLEARSGAGAIKSFPRAGVKVKSAPPSESATGLQNKTFHCEICDVHVNSETQLKQHISSRRHKDRAAGKPAKPKFSPYTPALHHPSFQAIHLALRKNPDLTKPLASTLMHRQLSVAAASMASLPSFPLRSALNSSPALFHSLPLPQALLHPAPGPICTAHTPVLFAPY
ncbi:zinc finger protein 385D-like [Brachionichthys hirsutus]|uniref:zinc finger protein 385D-like n=1 Tax=Brachionichthys hirsutus TaxID=412623 RepID=UPI003604CF80